MPVPFNEKRMEFEDVDTKLTFTNFNAGKTEHPLSVDSYVVASIRLQYADRDDDVDHLIELSGENLLKLITFATNVYMSLRGVDDE